MAGVNCGKLDLRSISQDEIVVIDKSSWLRIDVDEKIYLINNDPHVVIKFGNMCSATVCDDQQDLRPSLGMVVQNTESSNGASSSGQGSQEQTRSLPADINQNRSDLKEAETAVDISSIDAFSWFPAAVKPSAAVVPMRSNVTTYGPFASPNFGDSCGGTQVEVNTDLAPWVFGSINLMNQAGQSIAQSTAIGLVKAETGSITIPGLPTSAFTGLGVALGGAGPTLSSMNFGFGSGGVSTTYEFRTYTPKFGGMNRHLIDKIKDVARNRKEQIKFLRGNQIVQNKISRKLKNINNINRAGNDGGGTLQRVLIGEIYDFDQINEEGQIYNQRTVVGLDSLRKSVKEMTYDYDKKAYISLDALYGPVSKEGDGELPRYADFSTGLHKSSPQAPQPPFTTDEYSLPILDQYHLEITQDYADPLTNPFAEDEHHHDGPGKGHVIDLVGRGPEVPQKGMITNFYDDNEGYSQDYRFLGMRGPIVLHSWGYDLEGKPIPNASDTDENTKKGTFNKADLEDRFLPDWLNKPATWPVAPIDFRFDRKRGVWVTPPGYKVVVAQLEENLEPYGSAKAKLINKDTEHNGNFGDTLYDKDGNEVKATEEQDSKAKIQIEERLGESYSSGTKAYCYYDTFSAKYIIIHATQKKAIRFKIMDFCSETPPEPNYGDAWTKHAGYLDKYLNHHILGIRIDCNGDTIDISGNNIGQAQIDEAIADYKAGDPEKIKHKSIFVNLMDTCGVHGPSFAFYVPNSPPEDFTLWKNKAATGFGLLCEGNLTSTCGLGNYGSQCSDTKPDLPFYDIVFLESYARFVECTLTQQLYPTQEKVEEEYVDDDYKTQNPQGNAAATIDKFYGGSPNEKEPEFYSAQGEIDFRVFDPYMDFPKDRNPFAKLDYGDKVLAVFNEKEKKYIIYSSLTYDEKVIKFALVDNKDIGDRTSRAVLVDIEGYPIDANGIRLTEENFADNFITVFDSFAIHGYSEPFPKYYNWGTTGFGPALGSDKFKDHLWGFDVEAGDWDPPNLPGENLPPCCDPIEPSCPDQCLHQGDTHTACRCWKSSPFIGYAISRKMTDQVSSDLKEYAYNNEIIFLESFANIVVGKIASTKPTIESEYYLGVLRHSDNETYGGFMDGRLPFTRDKVHEKANLRISFPLDQHYAGKYITGDFYDSDFYEKGDVYNHTDGCKFVAKLDTKKSKVNNGSEKLYYIIVEIENIANRVKTSITKAELSDQLNASEVKQKSDDSEGIVSQYLDGFIWDKTKSKTHYEQITIKNRLDWVNKALIMKNGSDTQHIESNLLDYTSNTGAVTYQVDHAGTIAQVGEASVPTNLAGTFGLPSAGSSTDKKISKFSGTTFYHGLNPSNLDEENQPIINPTNPWMTYEGSKIISLWDETTTPEVKNAIYRVIYAREAPVIITGKSYEKFLPTKADNISIKLESGTLYASCPGVTQKPLPDLLVKVKNPMGYGADTDDLVTLQRVHSNDISDGANYYYNIIGTGAPPGKEIPTG